MESKLILLIVSLILILNSYGEDGKLTPYKDYEVNKVNYSFGFPKIFHINLVYEDGSGKPQVVVHSSGNPTYLFDIREFHMLDTSKFKNESGIYNLPIQINIENIMKSMRNDLGIPTNKHTWSIPIADVNDANKFLLIGILDKSKIRIGITWLDPKTGL